MLTVKANLVALDEFSDNKPESVLIQLTKMDIARINDAIAYLKKSEATQVKIRKTADLYWCKKDEQDEQYLNHSDEEQTWEESAEGLIIMLNSIYYTATNDYDSSDILESGDLTDSYPELSALFKDKKDEQDTVSKAKKEALSLLKSLEEDCKMAISGEWDCSTDEGKEGFESMIDSIGTIEGIINKYIK